MQFLSFCSLLLKTIMIFPDSIAEFYLQLQLPMSTLVISIYRYIVDTGMIDVSI